MSENLNATMILSAFSGTQFPSSKADKVMTKKTNEDAGAAVDSFTVSQKLFPPSKCGKKNSFTRIKTFIGAARDTHKALSLPYETGWQVLSLAGQQQHDARMLHAEAELRDHYKPELRKEYPLLVRKAREAHNGSFKPENYPDVDTFLERFIIEHKYRPIPTGDAIAAQVFNARMDSIRRQLEQENQQKIANTVSVTWARLMEPVLELAGRLVNPETRRLKFIVQNVREIADRIPILNLTGDRNLMRASEQIKNVLAGVSSEALEDNASLRTETASKILALARTFGTIGDRKLA